VLDLGLLDRTMAAELLGTVPFIRAVRPDILAKLFILKKHKWPTRVHDVDITRGRCREKYLVQCNIINQALMLQAFLKLFWFTVYRPSEWGNLVEGSEERHCERF